MQQICVNLSKLKNHRVKNGVIKYHLRHLSTAGKIQPSKLSLSIKFIRKKMKLQQKLLLLGIRLRNFSKFTRTHCVGVFHNKVAGLHSVTLL